MKVLVTGGAGFIGSHTVDHLIAAGHSVTAIDNLSFGNIAFVNPQATFIQEDILNHQQLAALFRTGKFDAVLHFAAQTQVSFSQNNPVDDAASNILGTINLLDAARAFGVKRFIFASSAAVYGDAPELPITEQTPLQPMSFYGLSKVSAERYITMFARHSEISYVIFRYANVYGERQGNNGEGGVISIFASQFRDDQSACIYGTGQQTRDFIYVGDVAAANCLALTTNSVNEIYNISSQTETSINAVIQCFRQISGNHGKVSCTEPRKGDIFRSLLDNRKAIQQLQWKPHVSLEEGLRRTYSSLVVK